MCYIMEIVEHSSKRIIHIFVTTLPSLREVYITSRISSDENFTMSSISTSSSSLVMLSLAMAAEQIALSRTYVMRDL